MLRCIAQGLVATLVDNNADLAIVQYCNPHTQDIWKSLIPASKLESYRRPDGTFSKQGFVDLCNDDLNGLL